jgi:sugar transferase EpsL
LIVSSPVLLVIVLGVRALGRPVFFRQKRPGRDGRLFTIYKFRTMVEPDFYSGASDEQRLSCFGAWLRRTSLDELPELWNVLRGELSPVGSRPLLMQYVDRYPPEQSRRHEVLPRVTGWPQLHGRNATTWEQRFALDIWNVDHQCFWLDLKILALTIVKVLKREGISHAGHATMPEPAKRST